MQPILFLAASLIAGVTAAQSPPQVGDLIARNSHSFAYTETTLTGPGAEFMRTQMARSQFVLLGEDHMDHATPIFAGALFRTLHDVHGFRHLVVEQDPMAVEAALKPGVAGDAHRIADLARRWPSLFEFDTDEDLTLLARVSSLTKRDDAIWGVEQATGAARYLDELVTLAPNESARARTRALLVAATAADPGPRYSVNWLAAGSTSGELAALAVAYPTTDGSRAAQLLARLAESAEIFGYYRRAEAGEYVGLYNNTVREEVLKKNFLEQYRQAATGGYVPKAMFKLGANHLYHGKNPTEAFPIGNLAHEFAIANGAEAYGLLVVFLGEGYRSYTDHPAWLRSLLPATEPTTPLLVDLRALRPYQRLFREQVSAEELWKQRGVLHGYDAIVVLPGSRAGTRTLGGRS